MSYSQHGYAPQGGLIGGGAQLIPQGIIHPSGVPASILTAPTNVTEIVNVFVPNSMVGALIGTKVKWEMLDDEIYEWVVFRGYKFGI